MTCVDLLSPFGGYLRALGTVDAAAEALAATLRWRHSERPSRTVCGACALDPRSHSLRLVGIDRHERPVLYTCFSQALWRSNPTHNLEHLIRTMEDAVEVMASRAQRMEQEAESWVFVIDFTGRDQLDHRKNQIIQGSIAISKVLRWYRRYQMQSYKLYQIW